MGVPCSVAKSLSFYYLKISTPFFVTHHVVAGSKVNYGIDSDDYAANSSVTQKLLSGFVKPTYSNFYWHLKVLLLLPGN